MLSGRKEIILKFVIKQSAGILKGIIARIGEEYTIRFCCLAIFYVFTIHIGSLKITEMKETKEFFSSELLECVQRTVELGKVWRVSHIRRVWGSWGCLAWRKGGTGKTLLLSKTPPKEVVVRWGLAFRHKMKRVVRSCRQTAASNSPSRVCRMWVLLKSFFFQELLFGFSAQAAFGIMDCSNFNRQQKIQPELAQAPDSEEHFNMCLI